MEAVVRPPALTNGKASGQGRSGIDLTPGITDHLSRADLAAFMLQAAKQGTYIGQAPVVCR